MQMIGLFKAKAEAVGGEVHAFSGKKEALSFILDFLQQESVAEVNGAKALWAECPFLQETEKEEISRKVCGVGFKIGREAAASAKIGISQMDWAIADTGTLVQNSTAVDQRLVSTLPDIHIAIISARKILPDLATALSRMSPADAAYLTFITGPSRTADIERVLTIGVHGPERLVIVLVDNLEE
ncbi:MAG TPA: lactate utilization protein [Smithellaceae bacterium]|nr:lactate utilization protein [Smithellaceae bacterium]